MNIAICEDNKENAGLIETYILNLNFKDIECSCFGSGENLLKYLESNGYLYQIYFMDIEMPGRNGIDIAKEIRKKDQKAIIIFVTDYQNYVFNVFEALPFRFINKPITKEGIQDTFCAAVDYLLSVKRYVVFHKDTSKVQLCCEDIIYLESNKRKIHVIAVQDNYEFYAKLSEIEKQMDPNVFIRIHVSYLINLDFVKELHTDEVLLTNGITLPISKRYRNDVRQQHLAYTKWRFGL